MNKVKLGIGIGLAAFVGGVLWYIFRGVNKLMEIDFEVRNVKFPKLKWTSGQITCDILLKNPSNLSFTVRGYNIRVSMFGRSIANLISTDVETVIPPRGNVLVPVQVDFDPRQLGTQALMGLLDFLLGKVEIDKNNIAVNYKGSLNGNFLGLENITIPIDYTYQITETTPPPSQT
jgi:hypothetical protein